MTELPGLAPFAQAWLQAQQAFLQLAVSGLVTQPAAGATERLMADQYRQLFALPGLPPAGRFGQLLNEIALDAAHRLGAALADEGPGVAPITTLRELHALWIACGEAAWSAAAHREEFAAAQAELLASLIARRAPGTAP
jgi:hypothetical protein